MEDLRMAIGATLRMADDEKLRARSIIAETTLPAWAAGAEKQIGAGPFFGGDKIHVVDCKVFVMVRWLAGGKLDHIPADIITKFPKLMRIHDSVRDHAGVKAWYAR
jgi:glutathione S-transferase